MCPLVGMLLSSILLWCCFQLYPVCNFIIIILDLALSGDRVISSESHPIRLQNEVRGMPLISTQHVVCYFATKMTSNLEIYKLSFDYWNFGDCQMNYKINVWAMEIQGLIGLMPTGRNKENVSFFCFV